MLLVGALAARRVASDGTPGAAPASGGDGAGSFKTPGLSCGSVRGMVELPDDRAAFWRSEGLGVDLCRARYSRYRFPRHTHPEFVVGLVERGIAWVESPGRRLFAGEGRVVIHLPGDVHTGAAAGPEPLHWRALYPSAALLGALARGRQAAPPVFSAVVEDRELFDRLLDAHRRLERSPACSRSAARLEDALASLVRRHAKRPREGARPPLRGAVHRVAAELDSRLDRPLRIGELAELARLSPSHLTRVFTSELGVPPAAYLQQRRIERAKAQLRRGDTVAEVALACGFSDQSHLTRVFRRLTGTTPAAYARGVGAGR